jgi:glutathione S-transferase
MAGRLTIWTYDWVPEMPRGLVRDLRLRWAAEEAGIPYEIGAIRFEDRATNHLDRQPFGQAPFMTDGDLSMFESGACLLHIARKSDTLMPRDPLGEAQVVQWIFAALNSIEMVSVPWWFLTMSGQPDNKLADWLDARLAQLEAVLRSRAWLAADRFTAADLLMADVLRVPKLREHGDRPASEAYVKRITARPAFTKVYAEQIAQFSAADAARKS